MRSEKRFGRVIVIGGSMAGLLGARVLSDHFEQVIILERDPEPNGPEARKGVPQGRHAHGLLDAGLHVLETLFPGLMREMYSEGAERMDMGRDAAWYTAGSWKTRYISGIELILCTRTWLEWKVRGRVAALPQVELRSSCAVEGLITDPAHTRVMGVRFKTPEGEETLMADLVVDAGGRGSRAASWLEALGYGKPEEEEIRLRLAYTSRFFEPPPNYRGDWKMMAMFPRAPEQSRGGFIARVEGGRWLVTLHGYFGDDPPRDDKGFLEFARSLPQPDIYEAIRDAKPLTEAVVHKIPSSRMLHYERMENFPEAFVLLGDSVCALNPVYGQGMTVCSLSAQLLGQTLVEHKRASPGTMQGLSRRFQRKLSQLLSIPWMMGTTMDLKYPQAQGQRFPGLGLLHWAFGTLIDLTSVSTLACRQFYEVMHMRRGMAALLRPDLLAAFAAYGLKSLFVPLPRRANVDTLPRAPA
ncbi:NAD(P)/FAD-dependent oxidoreductase [Hyalangium rubrum]|uniref:FAD-dependent monooxygenase n=1 Tax=Hyalangium rubrum TaxID=3103134 RepID=A0ABU5H6N7_9BACT|nr:FAD-dependent monooxygenase [Hyalangium sp. s54d21]MDY7228508.1 FAD-dependent monooxygenase [Hyalangium sp. s54d21]